MRGYPNGTAWPLSPHINTKHAPYGFSGGLRMSFTGQEPRHADGRQLQRIGIEPTILVRPTLAGIRDGKDEILDRALAFVANGR